LVRCCPCHPILQRVIEDIHETFLKKEIEENEDKIKKESMSNSDDIRSKMKGLYNFKDVLSFLSVEENAVLTRASSK
jgi:hypothetical protein